jgi:hypothetical protein
MKYKFARYQNYSLKACPIESLKGDIFTKTIKSKYGCNIEK